MSADHDEILADLRVALPAKLARTQAMVDGRLFAYGSHNYSYVVTIRDVRRRHRKVLVRIPIVDKSSRRARLFREYRVLQHLESIGFGHIPRPLLYDASLHYLPLPYAVHTFIESERLTALSLLDLEAIAGTMASLHAGNASTLIEDGFPRYATARELVAVEYRHLLDWMRRSFAIPAIHDQLADLAPILTAGAEAVNIRIEAQRSSLEHTPLAATLTHGDLGTHNFRRARDGIYIFDWELAAIGDPAFDIAKFFRHDLRDDDLRRTFLASYCRPASVRSQNGLVERIALYEALAALQSALWSIETIATWTPQGQGDEQPSRLSGLADNLYTNLAHIDEAFSVEAERLLAPRLCQTGQHS